MITFVNRKKLVAIDCLQMRVQMLLYMVRSPKLGGVGRHTDTLTEIRPLDRRTDRLLLIENTDAESP